MAKTYRLFSSAVIHEWIDDEVIIANLDDGAYYSLRGSAAPIWQWLVAGHPLETVIAQIVETYGFAPEGMLGQVEDFVHQLQSEKLLQLVSALAGELPGDVNCPWPKSWDKPDLEKYDEMKNLLLLDPVHEVDEQGWPTRSPK